MSLAFIFTGTAGAGKTSVLQQLAQEGHQVVPEAATDVIAYAQAKGIKHPWEEPSFIDKIICMQKDRQINAIADLQFFDRAPFCTYALGKYLSGTEFAPSIALLDEIERCLSSCIYQNKVFFFENLGFIQNTAARQISYQQALTFKKIHLDVYAQFGFDIIIVPNSSIQERSRFILKSVN